MSPNGRARLRTGALALLFVPYAWLASPEPGAAVDVRPEVGAPRGVLTTDGGFFVTWTSDPDPIPFNRLFEVRLRVTRPDDRTTLVPGAVVTVAAWMPAHNHGMTLQTEVTSHGDVTATARGLLFHMQGQWELRVGVAAGGKMERAVFAIALESPPSLDETERQSVLGLSPLPPPPDDPSNAVAGDPRAARLGERLFFDKRVSADGTTACATCHDPARSWCDGRRTVDSGGLYPKNVPSLRNTAHNRWYFWDGRADSAWAQALGPIENEAEMGGSRLALLHLIAGDAVLRAEYTAVFGPLPAGISDARRFPADGRPVPSQPDHPKQRAWASMSDEDRHAADVVFTNAGKALAAFERGIGTGETPFDRFVARLRLGPAEPTAEFPASAVRGLKLFAGRGQCVLCHSGPLLSDGEFHDVGLSLGSNMRVDPGRHHGVLYLLSSEFTRVGEYADGGADAAPIRFLDPNATQIGEFKTPSLRGVAETAPYMHDGRFDTLEQVVHFYSTREGASPLGHPSTLLQPLRLTDGEATDLVAFLRCLSAVE